MGAAVTRSLLSAVARRGAPIVAALSLVVMGCAARVAARPRELAAPGLSAAAVRTIDAAVARTLAQGSPGMAVAVTRRGQVVFARGYGLADLEHHVPVTRDTVFKLASVTKQFTAAAVLLLAQDGKLALDDRLSRHVPELAQAAEVTLYHLLVQTSGVPDYAEDPSGAPLKSVARTPTEMLAWIDRLTPALAFEPGTRWAYSNSNYVLLGLVVERVSGERLGEFFARRLFVPAGLRHTAFDDPADVVSHRAAGYRRSSSDPGGFQNAAWISPTIPGPAGGLRTTIDVLVRWSDALFAGRIIAADSLARMTSAGRLNDGRTTRWGMPKDWREGLDADYGMGVFVSVARGRRRIWHSGEIDGFTAWLAHYPDDAVTIALLENSESADMDRDAIEAAVFSSLAGR